MSDGVAITAGTGTTISTDQLADSSHVQYVKLMSGTANAEDKIGGDATNGLDVDVTRVTGSVAVTNAGMTAIGSIVSGTEAQVDVVSSDGIAAEGAALGNGILIQGDDGTDRTNVLVDTSGHLQVDVVTAPSTAVTNAGTFATQATLQAGSALVGKVSIDQATANANEVVVKSGTVTAVTAITNALPAGTALLGKVGIDQVTANANEVVVKSGTVTAVTAITNALPAGTALLGKMGIDQVTANANEVVVKSGTVTAVTAITNALPAGDNNVGNVDIVTMPAVVLGAGTAEYGKLAAGSALIGKVSIDQVTANANEVVVKSITAGDTNIGNVDIASIAAGDANIGNVDVATIAAGDNNIGNVDIASIAAGETHLGFVASNDTVLTIDATPDTSALAEGDVAFATQEVANFARVNGATTLLQSVVVTDVDDQGIGIDLIFFNANTNLGTENSAPDLDDTEVLTVIGRVQVGAGAFYDLGASKVASIGGIGLEMKAGAAATSIYMAGIARGAPTYAGGHLQIQLGIMRLS